MRDLAAVDRWITNFERKQSRLHSAASLENASVTGGRVRFIGGTLRVDSGGRVEIVGALVVDGQTGITGPVRITGRLDVDGPWAINGDGSITGRMQVTGPWGLQGDGSITGRVDITGDTTIAGTTQITGNTTLDADLDVRNGRILIGPMLIDRGSIFGARIHSPNGLALSGASVNVLADVLRVNDLAVNGVATITALDVTGAKNFRTDHPTKPGMWLRHGATESPVSGTEYTGRCRFDENGEAQVELPDYFEGLNKPEGRTVHITPVGRPFPVGASDVEDGTFTAYGEADREAFWLVKAERYGGDFMLEEQATIQQTEGATAEP